MGYGTQTNYDNLGSMNNTAAAPAAPAAKKAYTPQEAAQLGLGWVDANNSNYGKAGFVGSEAPAPAAPAAPGAPAAGGAPAPITNAQQVTGTQANVGQTAAQGAPTTIAQSFQQALVNRLNPTPVSANAGSPTIAPAIQANQLAEQRNFEHNRNLLAERSAANGTNNSGGFETGLLGLAQDRAQREGQFAGNAVMQEQNRQDANQNSALGLSGSMLTGQQGLSQQMDLANLDATLRREGLGVQSDLGSRDLALRGRLGDASNNLGLLGLLQGGDQFTRQLGQQGAQFGQSLDQQGLLALLGGLG